MSSRPAHILCAALAVVLLLLTVPFSTGSSAAAGPEFTHAPADDRPLDVIRDGIRRDGFYVHPAAANGDGETWNRRIRSALKQMDLPAPIVVAMWPDGVANDEPFLEVDEGLAERLRVSRGILLVDDLGFATEVVVGKVSQSTRVRWEAISDQTEAIEAELLRFHPDRESKPQLLSVADAWIRLRLAAADGPTARELADELIGDENLYVDARRYDPASESLVGSEGDDGRGPLMAIIFFSMLGITLLFLARAALVAIRAGSGARAREHGGPRDAWDRQLTPVMVEAELTALAEQIAASDVQPGDPNYERAQAAADAAVRYVDSNDARDRVGVHLLVEDGLTALLGEEAQTRCFFHPRHVARTTVSRSRGGVGGADVPACRDCERAIKTGARPMALMLPDENDQVAPYFTVDDVWSRTGYGSLDPSWATVVLHTSLGINSPGTRGGQR